MWPSCRPAEPYRLHVEGTEAHLVRGAKIVGISVTRGRQADRATRVCVGERSRHAVERDSIHGSGERVAELHGCFLTALQLATKAIPPVPFVIQDAPRRKSIEHLRRLTGGRDRGPTAHPDSRPTADRVDIVGQDGLVPTPGVPGVRVKLISGATAADPNRTRVARGTGGP